MIHVEERSRNDMRHDPRVDDGDEWIVVAGDHKCGLSDHAQEGQTAPACRCGELVVVAASWPETGVPVQYLFGPFGVRPHRSAVDLTGDAARVLRIAVSAGCHHPAQHVRAGGDHE